METRLDCWYSERLQKEMRVRTYGNGGVPVLAFPPQQMLSDAYEKAGVTDTLARWIDGQRMRLVTVDTIDGESWFSDGDRDWRANRQETYYEYISEEVVPFVLWAVGIICRFALAAASAAHMRRSSFCAAPTSSRG